MGFFLLFMVSLPTCIYTQANVVWISLIQGLAALKNNVQYIMAETQKQFQWLKRHYHYEL